MLPNLRHIADAKGKCINNEVGGLLGALPVLAGDDLARADGVRVKVAQGSHIDAIHLCQIMRCHFTAFQSRIKYPALESRILG